MANVFTRALSRAAWLAGVGSQAPPVRTTYSEGLTTDGIEEWLNRVLSGTTNISYEAYYARSIPVYRGAKLRADAVGRARPKVYRLDAEGNKEWVGEEDVVQRLLDRVMKGMTHSRMWQLVETSLCLRGESYRWVNKPNADVESWEIVPLLATQVRPVVRAGVIIAYEHTGLGGVVTHLPAEDVIYDRYVNPRDLHRGLSPLEPARSAIGLHLQMMRSNESFWKYGSHVANLAFFLGTGTTRTEAEQFQEQFRDRHAGAGQAHRPITIAGDKGSVVNLGQNNRDMEFLGGLGMMKELVADALGVPEELMAGAQHPTFSNRKEAGRDFYSNTIAGEWAMLESELQEQFVPMLPVQYAEVIIRFDRADIEELQETQAERVDRQVKETGAGLMTRNEARKENGRGEIEGGDLWSTAPTGDMVLVEYDDEPEPQNTPIISGDDDDAQRAYRARPTRRQRKLLREFRRIEEQQRKAFTGDIDDALDDLGIRARKAFEQVTGMRQNFPEDDDLVERIVNAMNMNQWEQAHVVGAYDEHYRSTLYSTVNAVNSAMGLSIGITDPMEARVLAVGGTQRGLADFSGQARRSLFRAIRQAREEGEGPIALARRIRQQVPAGRYINAGARRRAVLIARTETKHAQRVSQLEAYQGSDVIQGVIAVDAQLGETDDDCMARNGQVFTIQEAQAEMDEEHPNGTLDFVPNI